MRLRKCKMCGQEFQGTGARRLCPSCRAAEQREKVIRPRQCTACGRIFDGMPTSKYCPDCAAERQAQRQKEQYERKKSGATRKLGSTDLCAACGKEFVVKCGTQKYCPDCAAQVGRQKKLERNRAYAANNRKKLSEQRKQLIQDSAICAYCGKPFTPTQATVTCSPECAKKYKPLAQAMADYKIGKRKTPPTMPAKRSKD